jgi:tRNA 5-methylaminomethyl-2-thiouridine biosynthesis bifunctional protein
MHVEPLASIVVDRWQQAWSGRATFVVLDLDAGWAGRFVAAWQAWQQDARRCGRLVVVAAGAPCNAETLARTLAPTPAASRAPALAARLIAEWPPAVGGWHGLAFDGGRVRLLLRLGSGGALAALRERPVKADAVVIGPDVAADPPGRDPRPVAKALARAAAPAASLLADQLAPALRHALVSSGFVFDTAAGQDAGRRWSVAQHSPRHTPPGRPVLREALVVGAGLAGAAAAAALAGWGWSVQVIDRGRDPAGGASGNPGGLYHGIVHAGDGTHARLFRAAALFAQRSYEPLIDSGAVAGGRGLLRLAHEDPVEMQHRLAALGLPVSHVQALDATAASTLAGVALPGAAWWFPGGGWLSPAALVKAWLATPGVHFQGGVEVSAVSPGGPGWQAFGADGRVLAQAPALLLAGAEVTPRLLSPHGVADWPLQRSRGQVSGWAAGGPHPLRVPVAGGGYALPLSDEGLLCGATNDVDDEADDATPRDADDVRNFERLARLTGLAPPDTVAPALRRVGWRLQTADRLPIAGAAAALEAAALHIDRLERVPRTPGLYVLTALGSRGITLAPLLGEWLAATMSGMPSPLERRLADAVDPARWLVRRARRSGSETAR